MVVCVFSVTAFIDFSLTKDQVLAQARLEIREEVRDTLSELETTLIGVQQTTDQLGLVLSHSALTPQIVNTLLQQIVEERRDILGGAIAFEPGFAQQLSAAQTGQHGALASATDKSSVQTATDIAENAAILKSSTTISFGLANYYYHIEDPETGIENLQSVDLSSLTHNYLYQPWYRQVKDSAQAGWSEPYQTTYGSKEWVVTYAVPIYQQQSPMLFAEGNKRFIGVVTADVSLKRLQSMMSRVSVGDAGFPVLLSAQGNILSYPQSEFFGTPLAELPVHIAVQTSDQKDSTLVSGKPFGWPTLAANLIAGEQGVVRGHCFDADTTCIIGYAPLTANNWPMMVLIPEKEFLAPMFSYLTKVALLGVGTLSVLLLAIWLITRSITFPLAALARLASRLGEGDLSTVLPPVERKDEVGRLVASFNKMQIYLKRFIRDLETETSRSAKLQGEMDAATQIQMSMLPGNGKLFAENSEFSIAATLIPAKAVGGDLYYVHTLESDNHDKISYWVIGDVSDKGVPAALFMAKTMSLMASMIERRDTPAELLAGLNNALEINNDTCMFVTLWCGLYNHQTGMLDYASGGHIAPYAISADGRVQRIAQENGPALGLLGDIDYDLNQIQLNTGDSLFFYTDGADEAFNNDRELLGEAAIEDSLNSVIEGDSPERFNTAVFNRVREHACGAEQSDDLTLMAVTINDVPASVDYEAEGVAHSLDEDLLLLSSMGELEYQSVYQLSSSIQAINELFEVLENYYQQHQLPEEGQFEIKLACEEVLSNIVNYGQLKESDQVTLILGHSNNKLIVEFRDNGIAYNPLESEDPELGAPSDEVKIGGLGVFLAKEVTDEQRYQLISKFNCFCFTKQLG